MYSFPVEVKITSLCEFTELEPVNKSPKKMWETIIYKSYDQGPYESATEIFINNVLYFLYAAKYMNFNHNVDSTWLFSKYTSLFDKSGYPIDLLSIIT